MLNPIKVTYKSTNNVVKANKFLRELAKHPVIACDFEVSIKYTEEELASFKSISENPTLPRLVQKEAEAKLLATALDHPSHTMLTHLSVAWSDKDAYVFILDNAAITRRILAFLVNTEQKQVWHNATYDFKHIEYRTGRFPKNYEDTRVFAKTLLNHVETNKASVGLKELAGHVYGAWGISSDNFHYSQMHDSHVLLYAATDACATLWVYNQLVENGEIEDCEQPNTNDGHRPWRLLPAPEPRTVNYPDQYFYHNVAKPLVKDTVRLMNNGLSIDLNKVKELEDTLDKVLTEVADNLKNNPLVQKFQKLQHKKLVEKYIEDRKSKLRTEDYYYKPFKHNDMVCRSYFMHIYAQRMHIAEPAELLPTGVPKWPVKTVRKLVGSHPILKKLLDGDLKDTNPIVQEAIQAIAKDKAALYNSKYLDQIRKPEIEVPLFNPNSPQQKQAFFEWVGVESEATSKTTGLPSWNRSQIERVNKETLNEDIRDFTQQLIDHSFADIVKNNFINSFYKYTVEGRLHGQYNLLGAKSGRYTSSNPNMLNAPSTGSIFAKPIKECFKAPAGFVVATIDYSALEDRVMANLSRDENKLGLFLEHLDGHSLAATYYYPDRVKELIGDFTDNKLAAVQLKKLVDEGNKEAKSVRQDSKPISFGLAYGAFPKKVAASVKIPLEDAELIFNAYHNDMYPGITDYRENYVLKVAKETGRVHLGLGFYIYTDDPERDIRTLNNATCQFWSILTALTINELHHRIDEAGLENYIKVTSTIYDSIYFEVVEDAEVIQWLNDNVVEIMTKDFMEGQIIPNEANLEIGNDWATLIELPNKASLEQVEESLQTVIDMRE